MATQVTLNSGSIDSAGSLLLRTNGTTTAITVDTSQNVGVSVTPSAWGTGSSMDVGTQTSVHYSGSVGTLFGKNVYYNAGYKYKATGTARAYVQDDGGHSWSIAASGTAGNAITFTQAMALDASANLLVGTTSTSVTNGGYVLQPANGETYWDMGHKTGASSGAYYGAFRFNGTIIGGITQNGTTAIAYNTTSDHRLKTNVRPADALRFMDIEFVDFEWTDGRHDCGVIAGQLQSVYPSLVFGEVDATEIVQREVTPAVPAVLDEEGNEVTPAVEATYEEVEVPKYQQVNYIGLIGRMGAMIQKQQKAIQEQQALITQLQTDVAALKGA